MRTIYLMMSLGFLVLLSACAGTHTQGSGSQQTASAETLGVRYLYGRGVQPDAARAFYYFEQSAKEDNAFAQNELAYLYAAGIGTGQDFSMAAKWYQKAAEQGLASAAYNLSILYAHGLGVQKNPQQAALWLRQAADKGFAPAKRALGAS